MILEPAAAALDARSCAVAGLASLITDAPWTVDDEDIDRLRAVGLVDEAIVQVVTIAAVFNHLVRAADGTGVEADYESPLPRFEVDRDRPPLPRPARDAWPVVKPRLPLSLRPATEAALSKWRAYAFTEGAGLSSRDRAVLARAAAIALCDGAFADSHPDASPQSPREAALAAYAEKLTLTPWRTSADDLAPLRALPGRALDDRGLLHVIATVGLQNTLSRLQLVLG